MPAAAAAAGGMLDGVPGAGAAAGGVLDAMPGAGVNDDSPATAELRALEGRWTCVHDHISLVNYTRARIFTCDSKVFGILYTPGSHYAKLSLGQLQEKDRRD